MKNVYVDTKFQAGEAIKQHREASEWVIVEGAAASSIIAQRSRTMELFSHCFYRRTDIETPRQPFHRGSRLASSN